MGKPRALVVQPPISVARDFIDYPYFQNLGAVSLVAALRQSACPEAAIVDALAMPDSTLTWREDGRAHLGASVDTVVKACVEALAKDVDVVVVLTSPFHRPPTRDDVLAGVLEGIRAHHEGPIWLADGYQSGQHYVDVPARAMLEAFPEVDGWVQYEAEVSVPEAVTAFRQDGVREIGHVRGAQADLSTLPFPDWSAIDLDHYFAFQNRVVANLGRGYWAFPIDGKTLPLVTTRGCPFTCIHCSSNPDTPAGQPKTQRRIPPERLVPYLEALAGHGASRLEVLDELINVNERHFDTFIETIDRLDLAFDCPNGMRADYVLERHLQAMRGRVTTLSISAESGSERVVREVVRKQLDLGEIVRVAEQANAAGVPLMIHYMIGLPGETAEEVNETLAFALDLWDRFKAWPAVQFATPLPGTRLAEGRNLPVVEDWGPRFQKAASDEGATATACLPAEELEKFMWTFQQRLQASSGPQKLIMNVTYVCNNHCTFCAVGTRTQLDGHPTRQREHLVKYREQGIHMVDFDGGEPTLNPELVPLIRSARALGYTRINVTTNGRRLSYEKYAGALVNSGLTTLLFSVHGPNAKIHAQHVGVAEAFEQTTEGIRNAIRLAPRGVELGMNITVTKQNHRHIDELAQLNWELGLRWMNIQFLTPFGRATSWVAPDTQEAADYAMATIDKWRDRMKFQVINLPFCFMPGYEELMQGDLAKLARHMVFVNNETVNLGEYLAERRTRKEQCATCPRACFCGGFYELDDVPEPEWLIEPSDLVRPIDDPRRHESVPSGFHERVRARLDKA